VTRDAEPATLAARARGWSVHLLTASGVLVAFQAVAEIFRADTDPRRVFLWLGLAVVIDAVDGPFARRWRVKQTVPQIDGRTIDDIVDYLTFTFIPLLLMWRMNWVPGPAALWIAPALVASLLGFANVAAKQESGGFFLGFPSYWNVVAMYAGIAFAYWGPWVPGLVTVALAALTVAPVRFVYPNLAPAPWRVAVLGGAVAWTVLLVLLLPGYPRPPVLLVLASLVYPVFYVVLSALLDRRARRPIPAAAGA
jgi:phosphatidylcholine synthase